MTFFAICLVLYLLAVMAPDTLLDLFDAISAVASFAAKVLVTAIGAAALGIWSALRWALPRAARAIWLGLSFLYFLAAELRHPTPEDEEDADDDHHQDGDGAGHEDDDDLYRAALTLLGLADGFTRDALDAAYKAAIRKTHPDAGGCVADAQAVNMARSLLRDRLRAA